jgi:hypothetical protein
MSVLQFPTFEEDDLVLYSFSPRADDPSNTMLVLYDEKLHEELMSRRNYIGCWLVMRATESRAIRKEILREAGR